MSTGADTGLWRGYVGLWEVFHGHLFLIGLVDYLHEPIDSARVFGDARYPIRANWFSGRLEIDRGERLTYYHMGWGSQYAERLRLYVEDGFVVARRRYDQRKVLLRQFNANRAEYEAYRQRLIEQGQPAVGALNGFTAAGLKVLGQEPFDDGEPWPEGPSEEEMAQWILPMLKHCSRPK